MDLKDYGIGAVVVIGGVVYGISSGGLQDALTSEMRNVTEVTYEDRAEYMDEIVVEFADMFETYIVQTETYDYVGYSAFSTAPSQAMFVEVVTSDEPVPNAEFRDVRANVEYMFCEQDEMRMFTDKGWSYSFTMKDGDGRDIFDTVCRPNADYFRSDAVS